MVGDRGVGAPLKMSDPVLWDTRTSSVRAISDDIGAVRSLPGRGLVLQAPLKPGGRDTCLTLVSQGRATDRVCGAGRFDWLSASPDGRYLPIVSGSGSGGSGGAGVTTGVLDTETGTVQWWPTVGWEALTWEDSEHVLLTSTFQQTSPSVSSDARWPAPPATVSLTACPSQPVT